MGSRVVCGSRLPRYFGVDLHTVYLVPAYQHRIIYGFRVCIPAQNVFGACIPVYSMSLVSVYQHRMSLDSV